MKRLFLLTRFSVLLLILNQTPVAHSECNACNAATNTACLSQTEYKQCEDGKPFGILFPCNESYYCSILGGCSKTEDLRDCNFCSKCNQKKTFACTGTQSFALCLGGDSITEMTGQCTDDFTCNINDSNICGNSSPTCSYRDDPTPAPTTTTTEPTTTTTPSPAQNPDGFCQLVQKEGRFPVGTNPQTTCRQYVRCVKLANVWYGPIYNCPGQTYFDVSKNGCVLNRPSTCSATIAHLAFRNIVLE